MLALLCFFLYLYVTRVTYLVGGAPLQPTVPLSPSISSPLLPLSLPPSLSGNCRKLSYLSLISSVSVYCSVCYWKSVTIFSLFKTARDTCSPQLSSFRYSDSFQPSSVFSFLTLSLFTPYYIRPFPISHLLHLYLHACLNFSPTP